MKHRPLMRSAVAATHGDRHGAARTDRSGAAAPRERRRLRRSFPALSRFGVEHLLLLPIGALAAFVWSNTTAAESYYRFTYAISFAVNYVAMAFFFGFMMKEVVEATVRGGVLHPWRRALLPAVGSIGVVAVPALLYVGIVRAMDEPMLATAWLVPSAIDVAFCYFIARLIFRPRHPAIPFLLLLAIAANAVALLLVGLLYATADLRVAAIPLLLAPALATASLLRKARVRSFWPYIAIAGSLSWFAFYWAGLHPALALVPIVPFLPHAARDPGFFVDASPDASDALSRFEHVLRYPVQVTLFFFGLVNAGVPLNAMETGMWMVPIATLAGKPLGLLAATAIALAAGLHLPHGIGWRDLFVVAVITAMGFGAGLFLASAILAQGQLLSEVRMGVLLSFAAAPLALVAARALRVGRFG